MKKIYIAKVLIEDIDLNSCSVEVFPTLDGARKWADKEIDSYASEYDGSVTERADNYYVMKSGDTYVSIEVEEKEINI